jgi:5'-deoxynucleotidase YfbR-like HD superfamily hydrolase
MDHYEAWRSGKVQRMHTRPQLHPESVAEHTWGVLLALLRYYPQASTLLLKLVVMHDVGEIATGDIPGHVKWGNPQLGAFIGAMEEEHRNQIVDLPRATELEAQLLEVFDRLDFCVSCIHEMRLGNLNSAVYFQRAYEKAASVILELDPAQSYTELHMRKACEAFYDEVTRLKSAYLSHVPEEEYVRGK